MRAGWDSWKREQEEYWASDEGLAVTAARKAEEAALTDWIATEPAVSISRHGGFAPEQWQGHVDGRSFYFRERNGHWRIELDLVPNGHFVEVWNGGDLDDASPRAMRELETGTVLAEGVVNTIGYGETPTERAVHRGHHPHAREAPDLHGPLGHARGS